MTNAGKLRAHLLPVLPEDDAYLALFQGAHRVAADCQGEAPRRERASLGSRSEPAIPLEQGTVGSRQKHP